MQRKDPDSSPQKKTPWIFVVNQPCCQDDVISVTLPGSFDSFLRKNFMAGHYYWEGGQTQVITSFPILNNQWSIGFSQFMDWLVRF